MKQHEEEKNLRVKKRRRRGDEGEESGRKRKASLQWKLLKDEGEKAVSALFLSSPSLFPSISMFPKAKSR